jgi:microcystin-dependent protein
VISTAAGKIEIFASSSVPVGYLECNGAAISRTTYISLFAAIGTTYGVGDGSTTFNVPDLRGEFIRGWDNGRGVDPGRSFGSYQGESLKAHKHVLSNYRAANAQVVGPNGAEISTVGTGPPVETSDTGGTETRPRNIAFLVCIKV